MTPPVSKDDLLAPTQVDVLRTASEREMFLAQVSQSLAGSLHTDRAVDLALGLLVPGVVDWAQVLLRDGSVLRCRAQVAGGEVGEASVYVAATDGTLVQRVMTLGVTDLMLVPADNGAQEALSSAVPAEQLRTSLAGIRPVDLLMIPLKARGTTFGTLTVAREAGDGFDSGAVSFLEDFAHRVALCVDATRALAETRRVADALSRDLAPPHLPEIPGVALASHYRVAFEHDALGGDFYDVHGPDDDTTVVVGDVCGKGVEASVLTGKVRQAVRTAALVDRSPARILDLVNRVLVDEGRETFVTAVCARVRRTPAGLRLDLASAGHPEPYVVRRDGGVEQVPVSGTVMGVLGTEGYDELTIHLGAGDTCLLYTDGIVEAPGLEERFGDERLTRALANVAGVDASSLVESLAVAVAGHLGDRPHDDIALLAVQNQA